MKTLRITFQGDDYAMLYVASKAQARDVIHSYQRHGSIITSAELDGENFPVEFRAFNWNN